MPYKDPEVRRAYQREYQRQWNADNPERRAQISQASDSERATSPERVGQRSDHRRRRHLRQKMDVIERYGGACTFCGDDRLEVLTMDHINGDGRKHRAEIAGRYRNIYDYLARTETRLDLYRVLCANCHQAWTNYGVGPWFAVFRSWSDWRSWAAKRLGGRA